MGVFWVVGGGQEWMILVTGKVVIVDCNRIRANGHPKFDRKGVGGAVMGGWVGLFFVGNSNKTYNHK